MDVSKIELLNQTLNIKDMESRTNINNINTKLNTNKIIIVTDSYGNYPTTDTSYLALLKNFYKINTIYSTAINGSGFGVGGNTFQMSLQNLINTLNTDTKNLISDVYVLGGANDRSHTSDIRSGAIEFATIVKTNLPNAKMHVGFLGYKTQLSDVATMYEAMRIYHTLQDIGFTYCTGVDQCLRRTGIGSDTLHPNDYGAYCLARGVYNVIMTGATQVATEQRELSYQNTGVVTSISGLAGISEFRRDGIVHYFAILNSNYVTLNMSNQNFTATRIIPIIIVNDADVTWRGRNIGSCITLKAIIGSVENIVTLKYGEDQTIWLFVPGKEGQNNVNTITLFGNWGISMDDFYSN